MSILVLSNGECDLHPPEHPIVDNVLHLDDLQSFEYGILDRGVGKPCGKYALVSELCARKAMQYARGSVCLVRCLRKITHNIVGFTTVRAANFVESQTVQNAMRAFVT